MKKTCLLVTYIMLCSCTVTTTSSGKRIVKGPSEFFKEQTKNVSEALDSGVTDLNKNDSTQNPEDSYPKASEDANILYELKSNWERTHFYIDSKEVGVARTLKVKINNHEHTVVAKPEDCIRKEDVIRPPYNYHAPLSFTFLIGECNKIHYKSRSKKHRYH